MLFGREAHEHLLAGAEKVFKAVGKSYSPRGRLTAIGRPFGFPITIGDGVNIAREVGSENEFESQGIMMLQEAAKRQVELVGDGTTLTTILGYKLIEKGFYMIDEQNINPAVVRKQITEALPALIAELERISKPIKNRDDIFQVARISSTTDEIAEIVTQAYEKVGKDGQVTVEENKAPFIELTHSEGMQIDKGYATDYFITDPDHMKAVLTRPVVIILRKQITTQLEAKLLVEVAMQFSRPILFIGEVQGEALRLLVVNKVRGVIQAAVIPPPAGGQRRVDLLEDIAVVTGGKVIDKDDVPLDENAFKQQFDIAWIGSAKMAVLEKDKTVIVRDELADAESDVEKKKITERNKAVEERITYLRRMRDEEKNIYDKELWEDRLAKLTTGVASIKVGATVNVSVREPIERAKDAVAAAKACQQKGIVPGGGVSFLAIAKLLEKKNRNYGEELLYQALQEPLAILLENSGITEKDKIIADIKKKGGSFGYNCETESVEDLIKSGVIDPTMVLIHALENAISVATTMLLTDTIICDAPEKNDMRVV